jgi:spore germination cell wall hydrolase CwlJ-like protein
MIDLALVCIALNVYYEARNDNMAGKVAVAQVVMQRMHDPRWPVDACSVVYQPAQFSWYWDGKSDTPRDMLAWDEAQLIASAVLAGSGHANLDATHYHAYYVVPTDWPMERMEFIAQIGYHLFWKETT